MSAWISAVTMSSPGFLALLLGHLHRVLNQLDRRHLRVDVGELRVVAAGHLVRPVEQLAAILLRHAEQTGDRLQRQLARHLLDEVPGTCGRRSLGDLLRTLVEFVVQASDGPRSETAGDDLAQPGVVRRVHVEHDEPLHLDVLARDVVVEPRDHPVFVAGEDVAAPRHLLDVVELGDRPVAAVVESAARAGSLFVPPDRRGRPQLGKLLDRQPLSVDVGVGEIEPGRKVGAGHAISPHCSPRRLAIQLAIQDTSSHSDALMPVKHAFTADKRQRSIVACQSNETCSSLAAWVTR